MTRRMFAGAIASGVSAWPQHSGTSEVAPPDLFTGPNFCSHEHWGSIDSIGRVPQGFRADVERGASPRRRTGLLDLLIEPYFEGWLSATGTKLDELVKPRAAGFKEMARVAPWDALSLIRRELTPHRFTGVYQCTRRGLLALYGVDLNHIEARTFATLDDAIADNYSHHFNWYRNVMQKAHFSELVRPVHPEFYVRNESAEKASVESAFTRTVMRIDPFLDLWNRNLPRWRSLAEIAGVEPVDAKTWRAFLRRMFDLAASNHALGIKQLQAYSRRLEFLPRKDTDVVWSGQLTSDQVIAFQDWVVHECCSLANDLGWPHQIHVGTNNLSQSSPLPLGALAKRYPRMKIVMIHCWPFLNEAGWLAKHHPNVYIDTCWQPILNPDFFRQSMRAWWEYVPLHKITCGHDATTVEMAFGSALYTREILADILPALTHASGWTAAELNQAVIDVLHNNAVSLYGVGTSKSLDKESI